MDKRGNKVYLSISEQIRADLSSPMIVDPASTALAVRIARANIERYGSIINADASDELPHDRGVAQREYPKALARNEIYGAVLAQMMLDGEVAVDQIDKLR